ncbi:ribosome assembly protein METTL17, mitochondrial-like [Branchiostoma lanceolatum]|uniref:ribosome assembly protein METTL17, mitochondrial-like n=1 Tax=Branchiostoma lanceolatum TaxID=7740 RepID=UPI003456C822
MAASITKKHVFLRFCRHFRVVVTQPRFKTSAAALSSVQQAPGSAERNVEDILGSTKPRNHPGIMHVKSVCLPERLVDAVEATLQRTGSSSNELKENATYLKNYLWSRKRPVEDADVRRKAQEVAEEFTKLGLLEEETDLMDEKALKQQKKVERKVLKKVQQQLYHWQPVTWNQTTGLAYLVGKAPGVYAATYRVLSEIKKREPKFRPMTLMDYGSGAGMTVWAAHALWGRWLREYSCFDTSSSMNDLAELLLRGGEENGKLLHPNTFFRQYELPNPNVKHDLVVCAYSLSEQPSAVQRMRVLRRLWRKTSQFLVVLENGTNEGYKMVMEARDLVLSGKADSKGTLTEDVLEELEDDEFAGPEQAQLSDEPSAHVFSPCPHDASCPRLTDASETPCNFQQSYQPPNCMAVLPKSNGNSSLLETFSYVVLRKGQRSEDSAAWPRIVRSVLRRPRHVHCRMCLANGQLEEAVITSRKRGKLLYRCARMSEWGDMLPGWPPVEGTEDVTSTSEDSEQ